MHIAMFEQASPLAQDGSHSGAPQVAAQLALDEDRYCALGESLKINPPHGVLTLAHGSSGYAAGYLAHLVATRTGQLVSALPRSLLGLQRAPVASHGLLAVAMAQAGHGPEMAQTVQTLRAAGATTVALVDDRDTPLAQAAQWCLPLHAGPDRNRAPAKRFICSLAASARLCAHWPWGSHKDLREALQALPEALDQACLQDWSPAIDWLVHADKLVVVGDGAGLSIAQQAALLFKTDCGLEAEAVTSAELIHWPSNRWQGNTVLLVFALHGAAQRGLLACADNLRQQGVQVLLAAQPHVRERQLTLATAPHRDLEAITTIQSLYPLVGSVAQARCC
jgi:glucosamine--fructose-6-phosphate aminotransferase (isomerizing)